jgi:hypothetical protein
METLSVRLSKDTRTKFLAAKKASGLSWDDFVESLLESDPSLRILSRQLQSQANRVGITTGQLVRFLSSLMILDEFGFTVKRGVLSGSGAAD